MRQDILDIVNELNQGRSKDRIALNDIAAVLLTLFGMDKSSAYYFTKCTGSMTDEVLSGLSDRFFSSDKIENLNKRMLPVMAAHVEKSVGSFSWKDMDIEKLDVEELEKMGTSLLRSAAKSREVDTKEINDLIKMLDSVGALPKKKQESADVKQVVVNVPFNSVCSCGKEIFDPNKPGYFTDRIKNGEYSIIVPKDDNKN